MLMLHDPSALVLGTAADMRAMADALDKMKAGMVAAYRDKSGRDDAEIEALLAAETWLSAQEAVDLGLADRIEQPVRMAAHFDLSRFRNTPPQLVAFAATPSPQEDTMSDSKKAGPRKPGLDESATAQAAPPETSADHAMASPASQPAAVAEPEPAAESARPAEPPPRASAQVIDLDAVRAEERRATLAYVAEVHELCALADRGDLAASFVAKATPVAQVRRALLEARAAEDEATAIRSQVRPASVEPTQPAIDTAAIYAARNQNVR
jgi:ATP-dependent Clp protease, protease subunit